MVKQSDYRQPEVEACKSVMLEVLTALGPFRDHVVVVGGNVPWLIIESAREPETGKRLLQLVNMGRSC